MKPVLLMMVAALALAPKLMAQPIVMTTDTTIDANNVGLYENQDVIVRGCKATVNVPLALESLAIERNAANAPGIVQHAAGLTGGVQLEITTDITIQGADGALVASRIDASGRGYGGGEGPGAGGDTANNADAGGAGYGGAGGDGRAGGAAGGAGGSAYGSVFEPVDLGSGGGHAHPAGGSGGAGGGAIRLVVAGTLTMDGDIRANGLAGTSPNYRGGGGSGGSIWITCDTLAGTGLITAQGGNGAGTGQGGGGGGGRIAVYSDATSLPAGNLRAYGGSGYIYGGAGTVYVKTGAGRGTVYVDNGGNAGENTEFTGATTLDADLVVTGEGRVGPAHGDASLHLTVTGDALVTSAGHFIASGRGYVGGQGPGAGASTANNADAGGAGYGGAGGDGRPAGVLGGAGGVAYGSVMAPADLGSGGGNATVTGGVSGGTGGGALRLTVQGMLTLDGTIHADGLNGVTVSYRAGGGSGGSLWVTCGTLAGTGLITAQGGNGAGTGQGGGGGGGRIAVYCGAGGLPVGNLRAYGGAGYVRGGAGTVFLKTGPGRGTVYVDNGGSAGENTEFTGATTLDANLVVSGDGRVGPAHGDASLQLTLSGDVQLLSGGYFEASGRGYIGGQGPGAGGNTPNNAEAGGAGFGGAGGAGRSVNGLGGAGGIAYGSVTEPVDMGSGGGNASDWAVTGGTGGGVLRLVVGGTLTIDGEIRANGYAGGAPNYRSGGGSGGGIWITCGTLAGTGLITAHGGAGAGSGQGGGGGGGRIAVHCVTADLPAGNLRAYGGAGYTRGGAGTVYLKTGTGRGTVYVDNGGSAGEDTEFTGATTLDANLIVSGEGRVGPAHGDASLQLTLSGDVQVLSGGYFEVSGRGYIGGQGPGAGGNTPNNAEAGGAGFGGAGGVGKAEGGPGGLGGVTYGSVTEPADMGSGGGNASDWAVTGGAGGGVLRLFVGGALIVDGEIRANGYAGGAPNYRSGGGSGGGLWITCGTLGGTGLITAHGGNGAGSGQGGGGGGGRIAVYCDAASLPVANLRAYGGSGYIRGGAGTVFLKTGPNRGTLYVDNGGDAGEDTEFTGATTLDANLVVSGEGRIGPAHGDASLQLTLTGDALILPGGYWDANGRGYVGGQGPGAGGSTPNNADAGGGGYGGVGGAGRPTTNPGGAGGGTYGSVVEPVDMGSGGGNASTVGISGGAGGGALRLIVAGTLTVDGEIRANGLIGGTPNYRAGGGSGGSLWITCGTLSGTGLITAHGGNGAGTGQGGGGGGGRIAIYTCDWQMNPALILASGGVGYRNGQAGTIMLGSPYIDITQQPTGGTHFIGSPFSLSVVASSTHGTLRYQWRKNGVDLTESPPHLTGTRTATLQIDVATHADQGNYDVWLTDDCGALVSSVVHIIVPPPGDMNCDGVVNFADINPFVLALTGRAPYEAAFPNCRWLNADTNGDGFVNFADINPFVALLSGP